MKRTLLALLLLSSSVLARPLVLEFDVERRRVPLEGEAETVKFPLRAVLSADRLLYNDEAIHDLQDFKNRRSYRWGEEGRDEVSLFALVGGRHQELENRQRLGKILQKAGKEELSFQEVYLEHLFSMDVEGGEKAPDFVTEPTFKATYADRLLAEASPDGQTLKPHESECYVRFLRYYSGGHPELLRRLQERAQVPKQLKLIQYNFQHELHYQFDLKSVTVAEAEPEPAREGKIPPSRLQALLDRVRTATAAQTVQREKVSLQKAALELKQRKGLRSALLYFDCMLSKGQGLPASYVKNKAALERDADYKALVEALKKSKPEVLARLEARAGDMAYILQIFRAGLLVDGDQAKEGQELYWKALEKQPLVSGAWIDVGNLYWKDFHAEDAWKCWDTARRLAPNHEMLGAFKDREKGLLEYYPGFF